MNNRVVALLLNRLANNNNWSVCLLVTPYNPHIHEVDLCVIPLQLLVGRAVANPNIKCEAINISWDFFVEGQMEDPIFSQWVSHLGVRRGLSLRTAALVQLHRPALPCPCSQSGQLFIPVPTPRSRDPLAPASHTNVQWSQMLSDTRERVSKVNSQSMTHIRTGTHHFEKTALMNYWLSGSSNTEAHT